MTQVETLKADAVIVAHVLNALSNAVGGGLGGAWNAVQALLELSKLDLDALRLAYKDLVVNDDREQVEEAFKGALMLKNEAVQAKILQSVDVLEAGIDTAVAGIAVYNEALAVLEKAKQIVGG